jgi:CheY-like chemotaxis protein
MSEAARPLPEPIPLLVVDDDEVVRTWLRHTLRGTEFVVAADADSVGEALELAEEVRAALLLVDYRLSDGTGLDLVRQLRERGVTTPAVLMTAGAEVGLPQTALEAGFQGSYLKSGQRDLLLAALRLVVHATHPLSVVEEPARPEPATPAPEVPKDLAYAEKAAVLGAFLRSVHETMQAVHREAELLTPETSTRAVENLAAAAHLLKGGSATAGLEDIAALAAQMEATTLGTDCLDTDEIRRVKVLVRELQVRVERLPAVDAVGLKVGKGRARSNGEPPFATVVYIDDDPASLMLVDVLLSREPGFKLVTARSGLEGVRAVADSAPNLVFLDLRLPDMDGMEVLGRLRALDGGEQLPVVLLTGEAQDQLESLQQRADLVLTKPLDLGQFFEVVTLLREEAQPAPLAVD